MSQKEFVKKLTLKHKRENEFVSKLKSKLSSVAQSVKKPVFERQSKNFSVEYEDTEVAVDEEVEQSKPIARQKSQAPAKMMERLKEAYKL